MDQIGCREGQWLGLGGLEGFWEGFEGVLWGLGGSAWILPTLFAPLEVLYDTRFGSKHHTMVQLGKIL